MSSTYDSTRARLVAHLTQAGLSTPQANANVDALLAAAPDRAAVDVATMDPRTVPHKLVMAGIRAAGPMSGDSVRSVLAAALPLYDQMNVTEK